MRWIWAALTGAVAVSCATPYQSKGLTGGYSDEQLGHGYYFVEFEGNGYTSASTVMRYLHRRAGELCTGAGYASFVFVDRTNEESVSYHASQDAYGNAYVNRVSKPGSSAMVQCTEPVQPKATVAAVPAAAPISPTWSCTSAPNTNPALGMCFRTERDCETLRSSIQGFTYTACAAMSEALCFVYEDLDENVSPKRFDSCHPDRPTCLAMHDYLVSEGKAVDGECNPRR